jgi:hypothetical protein
MSNNAPSTPVQVTTADALGCPSAQKGRLTGLVICPTGAVTPTITLYDNSSTTSGTILFGPHKIPSGTCVPVMFNEDGVNYVNGVWVHSDSWATLAVNVYTKGA